MTQTVTDTQTQTLPDGTVQTTIFYSDGSRSDSLTPPAGSPQANMATVQQRIDAGIGNLQTWVANNPNGAVLTAAQTLVLAKLLIGLAKAVRASYNDTNGT